MTSRAICIASGAILLICGSATAHERAAACPAKTFEGFASAFAESAELQKRFTKAPLDYSYVVNEGVQDPKLAHKNIQKYEDIPILNRGLIVPAYQDRKQAGLKLKAEPAADKGAWTLHISKPDTDSGFVLTFTREHGCWLLASIANYSL